MGPIEAGTCQKISPGTRSWRRLKPPSDALYMNLTTGSDSSPRRRIFQSKLVLLDFRELQTAVLNAKGKKGVLDQASVMAKFLVDSKISLDARWPGPLSFRFQGRRKLLGCVFGLKRGDSQLALMWEWFQPQGWRADPERSDLRRNGIRSVSRFDLAEDMVQSATPEAGIFFEEFVQG